MVDRRALTRYGALIGCESHNRKRTFKRKSPKPTNKCPVCWACWLADKMETIIYNEDVSDLLMFSNAFTKTIKPSTIEFIETAEDA